MAVVWAAAAECQPACPNSYGSLAGLIAGGTTVKLAPAAGAVIRIVDEKGKPVAGVRVTVVAQTADQFANPIAAAFRAA